jgi:hypothetical protein
MTSSFEHISIHAVKVLARMAAKRAVEAELKAKGVRVTLVRPAEIATQIRAYLDQHPELVDQAKDRARLLGFFEKKPKRPRPKIEDVLVTPDYRNS